MRKLVSPSTRQEFCSHVKNVLPDTPEIHTPACSQVKSDLSKVYLGTIWQQIKQSETRPIKRMSKKAKQQHNQTENSQYDINSAYKKPRGAGFIFF